MAEVKTDKFEVIDHKKNYSKMDDFLVGVAVDENGNEGLIAASYENPDFSGKILLNPMIGGTDADKKSVLDSANKIAKATGKKIRIIRFSSRQIIKEVTP